MKESQVKQRSRKTVTVEQTVIDGVLCNLCGESCKLPGGPSDEPCYGGAYVTAQGQFLSKHLRDATCYEFDLCERCVVELMSKFKLPAVQKDNLLDMLTGQRREP